jgi:hypothetical protein
MTSTELMPAGEQARTPAEIYADIERLQLAGGFCSWDEDQYHQAKELLGEWLELPDETPEDEEAAPLDPRAEWLWDELEPLPPPVIEGESAEESWKPPHLLELEDWLEQAHEVLKNHWGDLDAYDVKESDIHKLNNGITVRRHEPGAATNAACGLIMRFEVADNSMEGLTKETLPEYLIRYLYWGALKAHVEQGEGDKDMFVISQGFDRFCAIVNLWREFPYIGVGCQLVDENGEGEWTPVTNPIRALNWLRDWNKRGRPDADAPLVRLNGQMIQADVGQMLNSGLEKIQQSGVGGMDLTAQLLNLAMSTGQPYQSIRSAWNEFSGGALEREIFASALDEMLKGDEPLVNVSDLAGEDFYKNVILDFQKQFDCDPMLVLLTVMAALGSVLPLRTRVRGLSHTQHWRPGILFVMILVVSGGMKSMLSDELVEKPIVGGQIGFEVKRYARQAARVIAALATQAGLSHPAFMEAPEWIQSWANTLGAKTPQDLAHVISDFTGEGIDRNAMNNESFPGFRIGTLLTTDEGRQLMGGDRYKTSSKGSAGAKYTLDKLKRAWDGKGPASVRGEKARERNYERIRLGILAFIQPEVYDEIASDETDDACGFWPRFLAYEAAPVQLREGLSAQQRREIARNSTFRKYLDDLYGSIYSLHLIPLFLDQQVEFAFSEAAEDWWYPIQCQLGRESARETASGDGVMGRLLGKLPATVVDVALLLHLLKLKGTGQLNTDLIGHNSASMESVVQFHENLQPHCSIPLETVQAAYNLCRQLMLRTAKQRNRAQGDGTGDRSRFLVKIQATAMKMDPEQKGIPVGQLTKAWNGAHLKKHPETKDHIYQALGALSDRNLGELLPGGSHNGGGFRYRWITPVAA